MVWPWNKHKWEPKEIVIVEETVILIDGEKWFHHSHKQNVQLVFTTTLNTFKIRFMALTLNQNQFSLGSLALVDSDTQAQVSATFSNVSFSGSNDAAFTVSSDSSDPNTARVTGVSAGTGTVSATVDASYTDGNTGQPVTKNVTVSVDVTVLAVANGENVSLQLNFSEPQNS